MVYGINDAVAGASCHGYGAVGLGCRFDDAEGERIEETGTDVILFWETTLLSSSLDSYFPKPEWFNQED